MAALLDTTTLAMPYQMTAPQVIRQTTTALAGNASAVNNLGSGARMARAIRSALRPR